MNPETEFRRRFIKAMAPEIGVEPIESGAINPGFPDLLLNIPRKDGLIPIELKIGVLKGGRVTIKYRADQNAKHHILRGRGKSVYTLVYVPAYDVHYLFNEYRESWNALERISASQWTGENLISLKRWFCDH